MNEIRIIEVKQSVFASNDKRANELRDLLKEKKTFLLNVMSSPGSGKTTTLSLIINRLKEKYRIGVMEADIDSDVDARTISKNTGVDAIQLHTGGMCHLDAGMTAQGLRALGDGMDLIFLENVGNLVCPAEYDTGAALDIVILSVPEGEDKPLKYPLVFRKCDLVIVSKTDAMPYFPFDLSRCEQNIRTRNQSAAVIPVSAKTGENMQALANWFTEKLKEF
jgi:hydrogenase nickel incorporation protein HypB